MTGFKAKAAKVVATGVACIVSCMGLGVGTSEALQVAGLGEATGVEQSVATDELIIRLTQGNPDRDGAAPSGEIQGVSIHLHRLAGLAPTNPAHKRLLEEKDLNEVRGWEKDIRLTQDTDYKGEATFANLAHGFYLVSSTAPNNSYREINDFVVAVPFHTVSENPNPVPGVIVAKTHPPATTSPPPLPPEPPQPSLSKNPDPSQESTPQSQVTDSTTSPDTSSKSKNRKESLAMTGAQVIGLVIVATILIVGGIIIIVISRRKNSESEAR